MADSKLKGKDKTESKRKPGRAGLQDHAATYS